MKKKKKKQEMVVYHNNYIEAFYQVDFLAKKIMIASSLRCRESDWSDKGCEVTISSNEIRELAGINRNSLKHLEHAVKKLAQTVVTLKNPDNPKDFIIFNYLPHGEYKEGVLKMVINRDMKPFVLDLQKNFTQYHIENIRPLKSEYSIRIFELLKMQAFKNAKFRIMLYDLRKMFGLEDKYADYNMLKKRVIEKAKNELKEHCEIYFEYREIKTGRRVTELEFKIFKQEKYFSDLENEKEDAFDAEFKDLSSSKKTELELKLNKLGWDGDFEELTLKIEVKAIEHYLTALKRELKELDIDKVEASQLHEYIESSIKTQAQKSFDLFVSAQNNPRYDEKIGEYSSLGKELIRLGFVGNVEEYIEKEGRGIVTEALELLRKENKNKSTIIKPGLLRTKVKGLKTQHALKKEERKEIERINREKALLREKELNFKKDELVKIYKNRVNQGLADNEIDEFLKDFNSYKNDPIHENTYTKEGKKTKEVLNSIKVNHINDIGYTILGDFLYWKERS